MHIIAMDECGGVSGGLVSKETIGCAVGGAIVGTAGGGPIGTAAGCIAGAAVANADYSYSGPVALSNPGWVRAFVQWLNS